MKWEKNRQSDNIEDRRNAPGGGGGMFGGGRRRGGKGIGLGTIAIALVEIVLIGGIWYASLKASHRIAGPVFVFAREVSRFGKGELSAAIALRETDMFQPEAEQMNASFRALRARIEGVKALSAELQVAHTNGADVGPLLKKLDAELSHFTSADRH